MRAIFTMILLLCFQSTEAKDNRGGKLILDKVVGWKMQSLLRDGAAIYWGGAVNQSFRPEADNVFMGLSAKISVDWEGFPDATQYKMTTGEIRLLADGVSYSPIGLYRKGGLCSEYRSSSLFLLRSSKDEQFLDLVFAVALKHKSFRLKIGEAEGLVTFQESAPEPKEVPANFRILESSFAHEISTVDLPRNMNKSSVSSLKPIDGVFLKLKVECVAKAPYADNQQGLYANNNFPFSSSKMGIRIPGVGYVRAMGIVMGDKAYIRGGANLGPKAKPSTLTFLFCIPEGVTSMSLLYNDKVVIQEYVLK